MDGGDGRGRRGAPANSFGGKMAAQAPVILLATRRQRRCSNGLLGTMSTGLEQRELDWKKVMKESC